MVSRKKVLFICTHNSARSQIAEGLARNMFPEYEIYSAGTEATQVNPFAIRAMKELGIDISTHESKTFERFIDKEIDLVVTVCDSAKEACPYFPYAKKRVHAGFEDPSSVEGNEDEKLAAFRRTRDLIKEWLEQNLVKELIQP